MDENQKAITNALRGMGCKVFITSALGSGFPDLLLGISDKFDFLVEIKDGSKPPSAQKLTPAEEKFHADWGFCTIIIRSVEEAIEFVNKVRERDGKSLLLRGSATDN